MYAVLTRTGKVKGYQTAKGALSGLRMEIWRKALAERKAGQITEDELMAKAAIGNCWFAFEIDQGGLYAEGMWAKKA